MADNDEIDLYANIEQDFTQDEYADDAVDLYDDVIAGVPSPGNEESTNIETVSYNAPEPQVQSPEDISQQQGNNITLGTSNTLGRRHQLYIGNLSWWTTDQDVTNAVTELGINDFIEVKFFENRANGQSKGFCVISLGSIQSMRSCLEQLPKKELNGQLIMVTLPTKQALNYFESQCKTRMSPITNTCNRTSNVGQNQGVHQNDQNQFGLLDHNQHGQLRMLMTPQGIRGPMPPSGMNPPRMPMFGAPPPLNQAPPRFYQPQWNETLRPNGIQRPGLSHETQHRQLNTQKFQGPLQDQGQLCSSSNSNISSQDMRGSSGPRSEWNRFPMHQGFSSQGPAHIKGQLGPRGLPGPLNMPPGLSQGLPQGPPALHVNPAFFPQGVGSQHPQSMQHQIPHQTLPHGIYHVPPHGSGPIIGSTHRALHSYRSHNGFLASDHKSNGIRISEHEFEDMMNQNRIVSSSAITRAVSDAAAGDTESAITTLMTAISLIKQSKVANDDRCKVLIGSLDDTLHGIESCGSNRHDRSRSKERSYRQSRRERSSSRYRDRSRNRDCNRDRCRNNYYTDSSYNRDTRERSRSRGDRDRDRDRDRNYSDRSREKKTSKSNRDGSEPTAEQSSSNTRYYESSRYRESESNRQAESDRDRDSEHRNNSIFKF